MTPAASEAKPPPLRISYLFSQFPQPSEVFALSDIAALREQGHEVVVHTVRPRPRDEERRRRVSAVPDDLAVLRPSIVGALRWPALLGRHWRLAAALARSIAARSRSAPLTAASALLCIPRVLEIAEEIDRCQSDVVHVFWARHAAMVLEILRESGSPALRSAFVGAYDLVADDFLVELALAASEVVFSHAEVNRDYVESNAAPGSSVEIVHRGIPLAELGDDPPRDPALWVTASALVAAKNVEAVLTTFAAARTVRPELRLRVFGAGPDRARLERCSAELGCSGAVQFMGHVRRERLFDQMRWAGVFLLLSKKPSERLPNVIKEALWAGCAVLSSRSEGIEELLPDSGIGLVVDPDDTQAVRAAVNSILSETEAMAATRRQSARELIAGKFSNARSMSRYVTAWRQAIARRAETPRCSAAPRGHTAGPAAVLPSVVRDLGSTESQY